MRQGERRLFGLLTKGENGFMMVSCFLTTEEKKMLPTVNNNSRISCLLVEVGERNSSIVLPDVLRVFLIGRVARYIGNRGRREIISESDFRESLDKTSEEKIKVLKSIGETSLILVGLLPGQIAFLKRDAEYFRELGKCSYFALSDEFENDHVKRGFYETVAMQFESLERVLNCSRGLESKAERTFRILYARRIKGVDPRPGLNRPKRS